MSEYTFSGNFIVMGSTTSCVIALTWGGIQAPWSSPKVVVPLVIGLVGLVGFIAFEAVFPENPLVRISIPS